MRTVESRLESGAWKLPSSSWVIPVTTVGVMLAALATAVALAI
jgi:hypothetical protein